MSYTCPYCSSEMDLYLPARNVITYQQPRLVSTPCCGRPIRVTPRCGVDITRATTDRTEDDWGAAFTTPPAEIVVDSVCTQCQLRAEPWSKTLLAEGWMGCRLGLALNALPHFEGQDVDLTVAALFIEADRKGFGWIVAGSMAVNEQLLVLNAQKCPYMIKKS